MAKISLSSVWLPLFWQGYPEWDLLARVANNIDITTTGTLSKSDSFPSIIKLILTQSTLFTTWEPHLSKHSRHSIISLFFSLPFLLLFQLSLLPEYQSIGKLISYICFPLSKIPGRFMIREWFRVWSFLLRALIMKAALWPSARTLK